jgi:antimicrobial peptide system SdpA family protein
MFKPRLGTIDGSIAFQSFIRAVQKQREALLAIAVDAVGLTVLLLLCVTVLRLTLPEAALGQTQWQRQLARAFVPEGWAFFTRDPREAMTRAYVASPQGGWSAANTADIRGPGWNLNGADRTPRLAEIALRQMTAVIKPDAWRDCDRSLTQCLKDRPLSPVAATLHLPVPMCGIVALQKSRPIPWEWRHAYYQTHMPSKIALLNITCEVGHAQG